MINILIVDDNSQNLYLLEILLKTNGFEVKTAKSGIEALEIGYQFSIDLIISDILMPGMDGFTLCRKWKADEQLKHIPFIFYTATYTDEKDEAFALSLGADRFLVKPLEPQEMLSEIKKIFAMDEIQGKVVVTPAEQVEEDYYKEYSEVLVRKLEEKMKQLQLANKRLTSLYQASCELVTQKTHGDLIQNIMHVVVETAGYEQANYFFYDYRNENLALLNAVGFSKETMTTFREKLVFKLGELRGVVGYVAKARECVNIPDITKDERWITLDANINSALFAPVFYNDNLFGVIAFFSQALGAFNQEDEQNIMALANSMAITFENRKKEEGVHRNNLLLEKRVSERTTQLELSNRDLEHFAQSVSYDLRIPLRAIEGYSRILKETCERTLKTEEAHMLNIINTNARKMDQLINDLLILSRSKMDTLAFTTLDMTTMAQTVYKEIALPEEQEKILFDLNGLENAFGDSKLIRQVWASLLSKAVHYVFATDQPIIQISSKLDGEKLVYRICINSEAPEKILYMMQLQNKENPFGTTELGLAIVQQIIEKHLGSVWVEGSVENGVSFIFSLPKAT